MAELLNINYFLALLLTILKKRIHLSLFQLHKYVSQSQVFV
jgi:hypothetical protein